MARLLQTRQQEMGKQISQKDRQKVEQKINKSKKKKKSGNPVHR